MAYSQLIVICGTSYTRLPRYQTKSMVWRVGRSGSTFSTWMWGPYSLSPPDAGLSWRWTGEYPKIYYRGRLGVHLWDVYVGRPATLPAENVSWWPLSENRNPRLAWIQQGSTAFRFWVPCGIQAERRIIIMGLVNKEIIDRDRLNAREQSEDTDSPRVLFFVTDTHTSKRRKKRERNEEKFLKNKGKN